MALPRFRVHERQVLLLLLGVALLGYGAAIVRNLMVGANEKKLAAGGSARVRWMRPSARSDSRYLMAEYFDPSLLALPSPHGFSGNAWAHLAAPLYETFHVIYPPAFLPATSGMPVPVLLPQKELGDLVSAGLEQTVVSGGDDEPDATLPAVVPVTNTVVQIDGALAHRPVWQLPTLPASTADVAVRRTRVLIAVSPDGRVRHAVLDRSSLNEALDQRAVELARQIMFEPVAGVDPLAVTWGVARFLWAPAGK